jgi:Cation transport ATPase
MALGALALSKEKRLSPSSRRSEEMAGVDILCSDKTGTLTKNQLTLGDPILFAAKEPRECILAAALASTAEDRDAIDTAVLAALTDPKALEAYKLVKFTPFDPVSKRTQAFVTAPDGKTIAVTKGAPQVIAALAHLAPDAAQRAKRTVDEAGREGFACIGRRSLRGRWQHVVAPRHSADV